jgi:hypothetical protein
MNNNVVQDEISWFLSFYFGYVNELPCWEIHNTRCWWHICKSYCNPSYSGGRDQVGHGSKPALANSSWDPISKNPFTKKGWWMAQGIGPKFKPQHWKKKKKKKKEKEKGNKRNTNWKTEDVSQWLSSCLARARPWVLDPGPNICIHTHTHWSMRG